VIPLPLDEEKHLHGVFERLSDRIFATAKLFVPIIVIAGRRGAYRARDVAGAADVALAAAGAGAVLNAGPRETPNPSPRRSAWHHAGNNPTTVPSVDAKVGVGGEKERIG
jgi:hypothetical protein